MGDLAYPLRRVQVQVFDLAMLEEAREANPVIGQMGLLPEHRYVILPRLGIVLEQLLSVE